VAPHGLSLQAAGWDFEDEKLLDKVGPQRGWTCLDLACGTAGMLMRLSRRVGQDGFVVGIDADPEHLTAARTNVRNAELTNVEILRRDVYHTQLPREAFDFVHVRLINLEPERTDELLAEAFALTRPGGVMAIQCAAWSTHWGSRSIMVWGLKQPLRYRSNTKARVHPNSPFVDLKQVRVDRKKGTRT
jgi:ubiquinone/menaquinone biosynthesis C-methylase UbiE